MILHDCDNDVNKAVQKILDEGVGEVRKFYQIFFHKIMIVKV